MVAGLDVGKERFCKAIAVEDIFRLFHASRTEAAKLSTKTEGTLVKVIVWVFIDL